MMGTFGEMAAASIRELTLKLGSLPDNDARIKYVFHADIKGRPDEGDWLQIEELMGTRNAAELFTLVRAESNMYTFCEERLLTGSMLRMLLDGTPPSLLLSAAKDGPQALTALISGYSKAKLDIWMKDFLAIIADAIKALQELAGTVERVRLLREPFPKPPRRALARGLSPVQARYWVNYKARDKLPRRSRKTPIRKGEEGAHGKERKGRNR